MPIPPLLSSRPVGMQIVIANVVPCVFGAICGILLGTSGLGYVVLSILAIAGGLWPASSTATGPRARCEGCSEARSSAR